MVIAKKILVLDSDMPPALTIARSLARMGLQVDIASHVNKPLAGYSRHVHLQLHYPNPLQSPQKFTDWLNTYATRNTYDLVIPVTERTVVPIYGHRDRIKAIHIALPGNDCLEVALDKAKTVALARQLGIPVPDGKLITQADTSSGNENALPYPVVIKPARSMGTEDKGIIQLSVDYAFNQSELTSKTTHALRFGNVILQEYFRGQGVGIELIADHGKIVYAFQHLRLHELPLTGGGSSLRKSVAIEPELLDASQKLMAALNWHGVVMVEFKWNPESRDFRLMEINGRFWGSLPLAVSAGADFPAMLYELLTQGNIKPRAPARLGMYGRKLSSDLYWYEQVMRRNAPEKLVFLPGGRQLLKDALLAFSPRHRLDIQQWLDPLPGLIDLWQIFTNYVDRAGQLLGARLFAWRQQRAWSGGKVARRLRTARRILFVCYGNINRSVLAGHYFSEKTTGMAIASESAGFHAQPGRPADPNMTELAKTKGINLETQRSRRIDHAMIEASDLIFVMEKRHYDKIAMDYPTAASKTFLLNSRGEIDDPYGKSTAVYKQCLDEVTTSVDTLTALLIKAKK
jgi:protein-tyrosine-phosphatase